MKKKKKIIIGDKEYKINCNAYTRVLYNSKFGNKIFQDIGKINDYNIALANVDQEEISDAEKEVKKSKISLDNIDMVLDIIQKITYIEILTANKNFMSYEEWLCSMPKFDLSGEWVSKVMEVATDCFR